VFLGKMAAISLLVLAVGLVCTPLLALLLDAPLFAMPGPLLLLLVLGAVGFANVGSVFAATLLKVRSRDVLLPVILYPILIPLFVAGTSATEAMLAVRPDLDKLWYWIGFLGIYDAVFLVLSLWVFEALVIE
jgi:ABC-type transport system involved in cytochrome c biogenesis permease component